MRPTYAVRVEILELIRSSEAKIYKLEELVAELRRINQKDYWGAKDVKFLEKEQIFTRVRVRQRKKDEEEK